MGALIQLLCLWMNLRARETISRAGVLALIVSALYTMYRQCPKHPVSYCIMAGSFIAAALLQVNVLLVIILCGTAGLISASVMNRRAKK